MTQITVPTINAQFENWAQKQPNHRLFAFVDSKGNTIEDLDYAGFDARVNTLASHMADFSDAAPGDRVLLVYQPGLESVVALFACAKLGLVAVPTSPIGPFDFEAWAGRLEHMLEDSAPTLVLACPKSLELIEEGRHRQSDRGILSFVERLQSLPTLNTQVIPTQADATVEPRSYPIAFIQYTSGSTSQAKGVCVSHENLLANCKAVVDHEHPVAVTWLPQHHDMGLIGYYIYIALSGGTSWGMAPRAFIQNPSLWLELMTKHKATATSVPNFALDLCLNERRVPTAKLENYDLSSLRFFMVAAEPVVPETFDAFRRKFAKAGLTHEGFYAAFGLAEYTLAVSSYGRRALSVDRRHLAQGKVSLVSETRSVSHALSIMSCGTPLEGVDIKIVDPNTSIEAEPGSTGEVWVAGASRAEGYWQKPDQSKITFEAELVDAPGETQLYMRTGDIGFMQDGELFICGRLKDMIIIRGQNIYPEDIEALVLKAEPAFRRNGIAAFSTGFGAETNITIVAEIARRAQLPDEAAVVRVIREGLQIPVARVVLVPPRSVARTSSGKIRRAETRRLLQEGELEVLQDSQHAMTSFTASGETDVYELEILKERYGLTGEEDATLFDAGIDSLDVVVFLNWLKDELVEKDAADLADRVNPKLLSSISVRELFTIARLFDKAPDEAKTQMADFFERSFEVRLKAEQDKMRADSSYETARDLGVPTTGKDLGTFVTGSTGFLGPFLIDALLSQSDEPLHVMVRGRHLEDASERLTKAFHEAIENEAQRAAFEKRVTVVLGDLETPQMGLSDGDWKRYADGAQTLYHNGALVNYLMSYENLREANVTGTERVLDLCLEGRQTVLNYISTTFIFGWAARDHLLESDRNQEMDKLDFGYSQSKWAAEQKVLSAMDQGLAGRVFRPALITPALGGQGGNLDITIRLLSFMIKHGLGVKAGNQVSFMPADICADNIVSIAGQAETLGGSFHVVRDETETMAMITDIISDKLGMKFEMFDLSVFVDEVIRRCTRADPLYPLLDFLVGSVENISAMQFKRYRSEEYQVARDGSASGRADPPLEVVVDGILEFLQQRKLI